jgi:hypothetical protein
MKTDNLADNFRSKMVETDVLACLVGQLQVKTAGPPQPSINVISALAKFGRLIYHFVLCED